MLRRWWWIIVLLLIGLGLAVLPSTYVLPFKSAFWRLFARPVGAGTAAAHTSRSLIDTLRDIRHLRQETTDLQIENTRLHAQLSQTSEVQHENDLLRQQLGFAQELSHTYRLIPATIIGRSAATSLQEITIDRGRRDGIVPKLAVTSDGFVVGRITDVTETTSQVALITASRSLLPITLSQSRATGLLQGGLAGLTGEEFETGIPITPGEGVVTSGLGNEVPPGLPVGSVERKLSADADFVQRLAIHSPIQLSKLELVLVVKPK